LFQGSILLELSWVYFPQQALKEIISPELDILIFFSDFSNPLPISDLQQLSTVLRSSRSYALATTVNLTFPFSDLLLEVHLDLHSPARLE
jgi:hypothetical protein